MCSNAMMLPGYPRLTSFSCYQCIYHHGAGRYMDAWMNFGVLQVHGIMRLVAYDSFIPPCPSSRVKESC